MHFPALPSSSCGDDAASPLLLKRGERFLAPDVYRTCRTGARRSSRTIPLPRHPVSLIAQLMVRREARMLQRLGGWKHAPHCSAPWAAALGMEFIPARP